MSNLAHGAKNKAEAKDACRAAEELAIKEIRIKAGKLILSANSSIKPEQDRPGPI